MKKTLALILSLCMLLALLAGCGTTTETPAEEPAQEPAEGAETPADGENPYAGQTLYVANWQAYSSDTNYCEKAFEDKFGCNVEHVYFNSYDELMTTRRPAATRPSMRWCSLRTTPSTSMTRAC